MTPTPPTAEDESEIEADTCGVNGNRRNQAIPVAQMNRGCDDFESLSIYSIGTLRSIYRLCVGTPRQGMLAPHSRGILTFHPHRVSSDSIIELQHYSHVFVVFVFHLNSNATVREDTFDQSKRNNNSSLTKNERSRSTVRQFPSKIAPPSLGGKKVGVFSTRTPHRPNPIGFSLCRLDGVNISEDSGEFSLLLSGLDIVDGTPILDVKPYVPHYDCVGYNNMRIIGGNSLGVEEVSTTPLVDPNHAANANATESCTIQNDGKAEAEGVRVPTWVDSGLQKRRTVTILPDADRFLSNLISPLNVGPGEPLPPSLKNLQFYGPHTPWNESPSNAVGSLRHCIAELLGVDVRSAWQTAKARRGRFQAEKSNRVKEWKRDGPDNATEIDGDVGSAVSAGYGKDRQSTSLCTQQIDNLLVRYTIEEPGNNSGDDDACKRNILDEQSQGSGAEDIVVVHSISFINTTKS